MKNMKISVIMPAYNAELFISQAIESILDQTFKDFELIIIDDGSTDRTWTIIKKFQESDDRIVAIRNSDNLKIQKTLNKGLAIAKGEYFARMDADDWSYPERLEKQYKFMEENKDVGVSGGCMEVCDSDLKITGRRNYYTNDVKIRNQLFKHSPFSHPLTMWRKELLKKVGVYNELLSEAEDYELYFRIGSIAKFGNLEDVLIKYRMSQNSVTIKNSKKLELITLYIRLKAVVEFGYRMKFQDKIYWVCQLISVYILPFKIKYWLFNEWRGMKIITRHQTKGGKMDLEQLLSQVEVGELKEHLCRYIFAAKNIKPNSKILDCASGAGYGTYLLAHLCPSCNITGVELDKEAFGYAKQNFSKTNLSFVNNDIFALAYKNNSFDYIVSFETIEHIENYEKLINTFKKFLKSTGELLLSTPNKFMASPNLKKPLNIYHVREFNIKELDDILCKYFGKVDSYVQHHNYSGTILHARYYISKYCSFISQSMSILSLNLIRRVNNILNKKEYITLNTKNIIKLATTINNKNVAYPNKFKDDSSYSYIFQIYKCRK